MKCLTLAALVVASLALGARAQLPPTPPQIDVLVQKGKSTRLSGMDYDDKSQSFKFSVHIKNKEMYKTFEKLKATLVVTGKETTQTIYQILDKKESAFDLPLKGQHDFEGTEVDLAFDDNKYAKFGVKYDGYALVIEDKDGKVVVSKASRASLLKNFEQLRSIDVKSFFDEKYKVLPPNTVLR